MTNEIVVALAAGIIAGIALAFMEQNFPEFGVSRI